MMLKRYYLGVFLIMSYLICCHAVTKKSQLAPIVSPGQHGVTAPKCDEDSFCKCHYDKIVDPETRKPISWEVTCKKRINRKDWNFECKKSEKNELYKCLLDDTRTCKVKAGECTKDSDCCLGYYCDDPFGTGKTICWPK